MPYYSNIPTANQKLKDSQPLLLANFTALNAFGNGYADFILQTVAPNIPGTDKNSDTGIYTFNNPTTTCNEMYIQKVSNNVPVQVPMTASKMSNNPAASCDDGWTILPSGMLLKWGRVAVSSGTSVNVTPTATSGGPNFTRVFRVMVSPQDGGTATNFSCGQRTAANNTTGNFTAYINNPSDTTAVIYLVMGV